MRVVVAVHLIPILSSNFQTALGGERGAAAEFGSIVEDFSSSSWCEKNEKDT